MPDQTHRTTPMAALLPSPSRCGTKLDHYEIVGFLGAGGMSEVYRAVDTRLGRQVALKTLRPALDHEEDDEVLLAEARAMAKLSHPHVLTVHEVDLEGSVPYVVMELVEGETARGWLRGGRTWREIVALYAAAGAGSTPRTRPGSSTATSSPTTSSSARTVACASPTSASPASWRRLVARATPRELGRTRFDLARALGRADARSIPLARQARAELAAAEGAEARVDLSEVDAWLAKR